jgi:hypothetical protein
VFRRLLSSLVLVAAAALPFAGSAAADPPAGACAVTPNPVAVNTSYQVDATGLTVNTAFTVHFQQPGTGSFDQVVASGPDGAATTSASSASAGTVSISWKKWQGMVGGGGAIGSYGPTEAACSVAVV